MKKKEANERTNENGKRAREIRRHFRALSICRLNRWKTNDQKSNRNRGRTKNNTKNMENEKIQIDTETNDIINAVNI